MQKCGPAMIRVYGIASYKNPRLVSEFQVLGDGGRPRDSAMPDRDRLFPFQRRLPKC